MTTTRARPRPPEREPARRPDRSRPALSADLAVAGMVLSMVALVAAAGARPSPESPPLIAGGGPAGPVAAFASGLGLDRLDHRSGAILGYLVMALFVGSFLLGLREAWRGRLSLRTVLWLAIAFQVVATVLPLLLSRDAYSYAMYGRIDAVYHENPYVLTPQYFAHDQLFPFVGPVWRDTPVVYGPAFTLLSGALARLISSPTALVWGFKGVAGLAGIGTLLVIAWTARRVAPARAAFAVALFGWNPAVVAFATGGGHNDLLVALCLAGALAVLVRGGVFDRLRGVGSGVASSRWPRHELVAAALLTLGALVKASVAPALVLLMVASAAARPPGARLRVVVLEAVVAVALVAAFAAPYWTPDNPTLGISELAKHREWISPTRLLLATLGGVGESIGGDGGRTAVEAAVRTAMAALTVVGVVMVARALWRRLADGGPAGRGVAALGGAWGWALLVTVLASPILFPWYLAWVVPVAWFLPRAGRNVVVAMSALLAITRALAEPEKVPGLYRVILFVGHDLVGPLFLALLVWVVVQVVRIGRGRADLEDPALLEPVLALDVAALRDQDAARHDGE